MNDNTILRIKVPAHLYESVKEQLTLSEAKKGKHNLGAGMELVKEKKMKAPKDGMKKMEEVEQVQETEQVEEGVMDMLRAASDKIFYNPAVVDAPKDVVRACINDANAQKKSNPKVDRDSLIVNCLRSKGAAFKASQTTGIAEKKVEEGVNEAIDPNLLAGIFGFLMGGGPIVATILKQYKDAKTPEEKKDVLKKASAAIGSKMGGNIEEKKHIKDEEKIEDKKEEKQ